MSEEAAGALSAALPAQEVRVRAIATAPVTAVPRRRVERCMLVRFL